LEPLAHSPVEVGVCGDAHDPRARQRPKLLQKSDIGQYGPVPPAALLSAGLAGKVSPRRLGSVAMAVARCSNSITTQRPQSATNALERLPQGFTVLQDVV
jgi:hypothetical protein